MDRNSEITLCDGLRIIIGKSTGIVVLKQTGYKLLSSGYPDRVNKRTSHVANAIAVMNLTTGSNLMFESVVASSSGGGVGVGGGGSSTSTGSNRSSRSSNSSINGSIRNISRYLTEAATKSVKVAVEVEPL
ncbi:hypothetical protein PoB_003862200 [Plakobranchus ocellatus]|uniref:Uncharacterized protein n=1 Tax=Plakobranchus ocellatus TaxID=259542 RepID=A0AAV4AYJ3_9GAST|nr:hypothetical protein PoB_003862200 [Plakobranchus ocellatus]